MPLKKTFYLVPPEPYIGMPLALKDPVTEQSDLAVVYWDP